MSDRQDGGRSVDEAMAELSAAWDRLMHVMTSWPEGDYTALRDAAGWTALDHLAHVSAWERSRTAWLRGRSRHEGLGVSIETFAQDYDALNEAVRQQTEGQGYDEIMVAARTAHDQLLGAISDFDFSLVDQGGITTDEARRLGDELHENLSVHYDEHRAYIEDILGSN